MELENFNSNEICNYSRCSKFRTVESYNWT
jgi:hypothetical protein